MQKCSSGIKQSDDSPKPVVLFSDDYGSFPVSHFSNGCRFFPSFDEAVMGASRMGASTVVVIGRAVESDRPRMLDWLRGGDRSLEMRVHFDAHRICELVEDIGRDFSVQGLDSVEGWTRIQVRASGKGEGSSEAFLSGVRLAALADRQAVISDAPPADDRGFDDEVRERYVSVLRLLDFVESGNAARRRSMEELQGELETVTKKHELLEKRYGSLSRSKLGRLTVGYWKLRSRNK